MRNSTNVFFITLHALTNASAKELTQEFVPTVSIGSRLSPAIARTVSTDTLLATEASAPHTETSVLNSVTVEVLTLPSAQIAVIQIETFRSFVKNVSRVTSFHQVGSVQGLALMDVDAMGNSAAAASILTEILRPFAQGASQDMKWDPMVSAEKAVTTMCASVHQTAQDASMAGSIHQLNAGANTAKPSHRMVSAASFEVG